MSNEETNKRGRPATYVDATRVRVAASGKTRLQEASDRRAIVNALIDMGGVGTIGEVNAIMGWDTTDRITALIRAGWLEVVP